MAQIRDFSSIDETVDETGRTGGGGGGGGGGGPITPPLPPDDPVVKPPVDDPQPVDLESYISISNREIARDYVKDSMLPISNELITVANTSDSIDIDVTLRGISGVSFTPNTFTLLPLTSQGVTVSFDPMQVNALGEGINEVTCIVDLASKSIQIPPDDPDNIDPSKIGIFVEEKFKRSGVLKKDWSTTPYQTKEVRTIRAREGDPRKIRWTGKIRFEAGTYEFKMRTNDGVRGFIDGRKIFDYWYDQDTKKHTAKVQVTEGVQTLVVEWYNGRRNGLLDFEFKKIASAPVQTVIAEPPLTPSQPITEEFPIKFVPQTTPKTSGEENITVELPVVGTPTKKTGDIAGILKKKFPSLFGR